MQVSLRSDGLYWPDLDQNACYTWTQVELGSVDVIQSACEHHACVIHAGANVGAYALKFAQVFETVYAFEPDRTNFKCLTLNVQDVAHIWPLCAALGDHTGNVKLKNTQSDNCGSHFVAQHSGTVPMLTIDSLGLHDVSCIHLDLEGYEWFALKGAEQTLRRCQPLVVVEWLDHHDRHGYSKQDMLDWLNNLGYVHMQPVGSDMMFRT
jgi:FkbM family methyltransferase